MDEPFHSFQNKESFTMEQTGKPKLFLLWRKVLFTKPTNGTSQECRWESLTVFSTIG